MPPGNFTIQLYMYMYVQSSSSGHLLLNLDVPFKLIIRGLEVVFLIWKENAALFRRMMKIHSNPPILYQSVISLLKTDIFKNF